MPSQRTQPSTLDSIAAEARVSKTTVSLVLNGKSADYRISRETEQRVLALAKRYGFRPNQLARSLRLKRTGTIGVVVSDITTTFFSHLVRHIEIAAQEHGCHVIIANTGDDPAVESNAVDTLLAKSVDGLIVSTVDKEETLRRNNRRIGVPIVYIDRVIDGPNVHCVTTDNRHGMQMLTRHLLRQGLTDIAYLGGLPHLSTHIERLEGFRDAFGWCNRRPDPSRVVDGGFTRRFGRELTATLLAQSDRLPQAIIAAAFPLFEGMLDHFGHTGGVPAELRLATFDDHPLLDWLRVPVSSVRQDCEGIGRTAFATLLAASRGEEAPRTQTLKPIFIDRSSHK